MYRSIAALLGVTAFLASQAAAAQSTRPAPALTAGPAPAVPWCPPGLAKDAAGKCVAPAKPPVAAPAKAIAAAPIPAARPQRPVSAPPAAKPPPMTIAVGEPNGDCTTRAPNLIRDSRSPGGCAPCPRGRVPNLARQACVIPIPRRY